jgi:Lar family restriction alleviation protein
MSNEIPMSESLRGCPFCGHYENLTLDEDDRLRWRVTCHLCEISGPYGHTEMEAYNNWNGRDPADLLIRARDIILADKRRQ